MIAAAYVLILTSLVGVPQTRCYENQAVWKQQKIMMGVPATSVAYYDPQFQYIALGPMACRQVRFPTQYGAYIYAHEIGHWNQDKNNTGFSEDEADDYAMRFWPRWMRKFEKYFNRHGSEEIVRIGP